MREVAKAPQALLCPASSPRCGAPFSDGKAVRESLPPTGEVAEPAKPEGLCRFTDAAFFPPWKRFIRFYPYTIPFLSLCQRSKADKINYKFSTFCIKNQHIAKL